MNNEIITFDPTIEVLNALVEKSKKIDKIDLEDKIRILEDNKALHLYFTQISHSLLLLNDIKFEHLSYQLIEEKLEKIQADIEMQRLEIKKIKVSLTEVISLAEIEILRLQSDIKEIKEIKDTIEETENLENLEMAEDDEQELNEDIRNQSNPN